MKHTNVLEFKPEELIKEADVYELYPDVFSAGELQKLRKEGQIGYLPLSRQRIFYRRIDIEQYLSTKYIAPLPSPRPKKDPKLCQKRNDLDSLNMGASGSDMNLDVPASIDTGASETELNAALCLLHPSKMPSEN